MKATTIEATGKKWKTLHLVGGGLIVLGLLTMTNAGGANVVSVLLVLGGLGTLLAGSVGGWWQHG